MWEEARAKQEALRDPGPGPSSGPRPTGRSPKRCASNSRPPAAAAASAGVWVLEESGKIRPVPVRTGITDNTYAALLNGDLSEGMKVILGTGGAAASTQAQGSAMGGMMMMGPPRR